MGSLTSSLFHSGTPFHLIRGAYGGLFLCFYMSSQTASKAWSHCSSTDSCLKASSSTASALMSKTSPTSLTAYKPTTSGSTISTTLTTWDRLVSHVWYLYVVIGMCNPSLIFEKCIFIHNIRITVFLSVLRPLLSRL